MQIVLDTNVLISFLLSHGETISRILDAWAQDRFTLCLSPQILSEIRRVLEYPHLKSRIKPEEAQALLDNLSSDALLIEGTVTATGTTADPKDDIFIACALEAKADIIVSGDPHLVKIEHYGAVRIVTPAQFVEILRESQN
ncbi:MAG: putative toxin-antitoxin system toxin component, PIN family [Chloroflexi bacterium]|nr:putative toxin-antitoxin system toxin component, PIN family [Chloroflexota bacterium]